MIIHNFATLRLKGFGRINTSIQIARLWHNGDGVWFAQQIREFVHYYQLHEQLWEEKWGGTMLMTIKPLHGMYAHTISICLD